MNLTKDEFAGEFSVRGTVRAKFHLSESKKAWSVQETETTKKGNRLKIKISKHQSNCIIFL